MASRFTYADPFDKWVVNRTTRYRLRKKRRSVVDEDHAGIEASSSISTVTHPAVGDERYLELDSFSHEVDGENFHLSEQESSSSDEESQELDLENEDLEIDDEQCASDDEVELVADSAQVSSALAGTPLYQNSTLTLQESNVLLMKFKMRHNLSNECIEDLLTLTKLHCPLPNECITSMNKFKKQFGSSLVELHNFCSSCFAIVSEDDHTCPNTVCKRVLKENCSSFIYIPIGPQLRTQLERPGTYSIIRKEIEGIMQDMKTPDRRDVLYDICSGSLYKDLFSRGVITPSADYVTVTFNTDGIPVFKSSNVSLWPMYLLINELPFSMRVHKEHRILAGLWYGSKPEMSIFLKPLAKSLQDVCSNGIECIIDSISVTCKVFLLACTCDLPAKATILNCVQYNGFYGCSRCEQEGKSVRAGARGTVRVFPYIEHNPTGPRRTHRGTQENARIAVATGETVKGVKGPSWLSSVPCFNLIQGTSVDYMHCVLLGVCRQLLKFWFKSKYHKEVWYIGSQIKLVDKRLLLIKPPLEMQRIPRSLEKSRKYWKAHELRAWLLHYSPVILYGILPTQCYQHHLLLVEGVYLLLKDSVSKADILQSSRLLRHYCFMFSAIYGERHMSANVHYLLHLPEAVKDLGPLWSHSCFPYEGANGEILKFVHGTQSIDKQVVEHVKYLTELPLIAEAALSSQSAAYHFFVRMSSSKRHSRKAKTSLSNTHAIIGQPKCMVPTGCELLALRNIGVTLDSQNLFVYPQLSVRERTVFSKSCRRSLKRNDSCVQYQRDGSPVYGIVEKIFSAHGTFYCFVSQLMPASLLLCRDEATNARLNDHIISFHPPRPEDIQVVEASNIIDKCIFIDVSSESVLQCVFVSEFPHHHNED